MAKILADSDIKRLLDIGILGAKENQLNPNGLELRLGGEVLYHSTDEKMTISKGEFLIIQPGETVTISSLESVDFRASTTEDIFPESMLMGLLTPTTTMMREGISQVSTKIDAGYNGILSWGLRNGSTRDLILQYGEPIYKLTVFLLGENEIPDVPYGGRENDSYMDADNIIASKRRLPAHIPKQKRITSSYHKVDPKVRLSEAGYPFDHFATELTSFEGKLEVVTTGHNTLLKKMEDLSPRIENFFIQKFYRVLAVFVTGFPLCYAFIVFLRKNMVGEGTIALIGVLIGLIVSTMLWILNSRKATANN